jgi:excisionase family DNA binding protein
MTTKENSDLGEQNLLTIDTCAHYLNLKKAYIYKLVSLGKLPYYKPLGGKVYFKKSELEAFVLQNRLPAVNKGENNNAS